MPRYGQRNRPFATGSDPGFLDRLRSAAGQYLRENSLLSAEHPAYQQARFMSSLPPEMSPSQKVGLLSDAIDAGEVPDWSGDALGPSNLMGTVSKGLLGASSIKNPVTRQRVEEAYARMGDDIYLAPDVTGSFRLEDNVPLTFRGKEPKDWTVDDTKAFGERFGVDLAPGEAALKENMLEVPLKSGGKMEIPGGYDGKFSLYEQHYLHRQGVDPKDMNPEDYWRLHDKLVRSVQPTAETLTDPQIYNQLMFGLTSPNNPLTPNQLAVGRLSARNMGDVERMADMIPWNYTNRQERIDEIADSLERRPMSYSLSDKKVRAAAKKAKKSIKKGQKTVQFTTFISPEGTPILNSDGVPVTNPRKAVQNYYSKMIADAYGIGAGSRGGIGASGSADYTGIAEFAQMYKERPEFFRLKEGEDFVRFVERVSNQVPGLNYKTGYMGTVWQDPMNARSAPVDRHIAMDWLNSPQGTEVRQKVVDQWNKTMAGKEGRPKVGSFEELNQVQGGHGFAVTTAMNEAYNPKSSPNYRLKSGKINPKLPKRAQDIDWVSEPDKFEMIPGNYEKALQASVERSDAGRIGMPEGERRGVFNQQWGVWDPIRARISPHESMNPEIQNLPRMSLEQYKDAQRAYAQKGYLTYKNPKTKEALPTRPGMNPMDYFYLGMLPPALIGGLLADQESGRPREYQPLLQ